MASLVVEELKKQKKTITVAESLTAGLFQATLADFSGASSIFAGGFVTYSLEEKSKMLSIPAQELEQHGVVSHFTAQAMASQARKLTGSDYGVSLTGVAGPDSLEDTQQGPSLSDLRLRMEWIVSKLISLDVAGRMSAKLQSSCL